jgi:hypothetical protein
MAMLVLPVGRVELGRWICSNRQLKVFIPPPGLNAPAAFLFSGAIIPADEFAQ